MITHLQRLESESIYILREVAAQCEKPIMLFSGGKDSIVMSYLAKKAFMPGKIPFPLMHIDTWHNFDETIQFRDTRSEKIWAKMIVKFVQDSINDGRAVELNWPNSSRNRLQTVTLLDAIGNGEYDVAIWWSRRDEEKARAKERIFSHRDEFGQWNPKNQRPELRNLYNTRKKKGEHFRVFPISNWTELDIWQYIWQENIPIPSLYMAHERNCFIKDGIIMSYHADLMYPLANEKVTKMKVRYRTLWDVTCTGAIKSDADTVEKIIDEVANAKTTERWWRADDRESETAMEDRKKDGYF